MRICLTIAYDGTAYAGWQRQLNGVSVQEKLEDALFALYGKPLALTGASRTDAGVHALGQRATFEVPQNPLPFDRFPEIINARLPKDIAVTLAEAVPDSFHPRFGAKTKTYSYTILNSRVPNPLTCRYEWQAPYAIDISAMTEAARHIVGTHDFACFRASGSQTQTSVRTIYDLSVTQTADRIVIRVTGNGFLYNMVRIIAGTLFYAGTGKIMPGDIPGIIEGKDRTKAGKTLPAKGLVLEEITY